MLGSRPAGRAAGRRHSPRCGIAAGPPPAAHWHPGLAPAHWRTAAARAAATPRRRRPAALAAAHWRNVGRGPGRCCQLLAGLQGGPAPPSGPEHCRTRRRRPQPRRRLRHRCSVGKTHVGPRRRRHRRRTLARLSCQVTPRGAPVHGSASAAAAIAVLVKMLVGPAVSAARAGRASLRPVTIFINTTIKK